MERGRAEAVTRLPALATLTEDAPIVVLADPHGMQRPPTTAAATWTARDGTARSGEVPAPVGGHAGSTAPIWTERDGTLAEAPTSAIAAGFAAVLSGAAVVLLCCAVVVGAWWTTRRVTTTLNVRSWEREWAAVEPRWRRNPG
jgi:hypothetical protein